jgi:hypothetical protein
MIRDEIVSGDLSGGATTSHTIVIPALQRLMATGGSFDDPAAIERVVIDENVLGKETMAARRRTLRYLKELYVLRADSVLFRALQDLWNDEPAGQPLLACLCAMARDSVYRASSGALWDASPGDELTSAEFADAVGKVYPEAYSASTLAKIGRNTASSWEQSGHLEGAARTVKVRKRASCTPATTAYALLLGHLQGITGEALFDTIWARALDRPRAHLFDLAAVASQRALVDFRRSGGVIQVGFSELLRPLEGQLL